MTIIRWVWAGGREAGEPASRAVVAMVGVVVAGTFLVTGCGATASCAGGAGPPETTVSLDPTAWVVAHPGTTAIVACAAGRSGCRRINAALLTRTNLFVAEVIPPTLGLARTATLQLRVLGKGDRVVLRRSATAAPVETHEPGPCGRLDVYTALFVLSAAGTLSRA